MLYYKLVMLTELYQHYDTMYKGTGHHFVILILSSAEKRKKDGKGN